MLKHESSKNTCNDMLWWGNKDLNRYINPYYIFWCLWSQCCGSDSTLNFWHLDDNVKSQVKSDIYLRYCEYYEWFILNFDVFFFMIIGTAHFMDYLHIHDKD